MDVFGLGDMLQLVKREDGRQPTLDQRQQNFVNDIKAYEAQQRGQPLPPGVATAGPSMAGPSPAVQTVAAAMPQPAFGGQPMQQPMMQQQRPMMGQFAGVALPRFGG